MNSSSASGAGAAWNPVKIPVEVCRALAGLEAGIVGGIAMLAWICLAGMFLDRQPFWLVPNLLASFFYGASALRHGFSGSTASGLALHIFTSALVGVAFGFLVRDYDRRVRLALIGVMVGLVWYHLSVTLIWRRLGALATLYVSPTALLPGHVIFGILLCRYPGALRSVFQHFGVSAAGPRPMERAGTE